MKYITIKYTTINLTILLITGTALTELPSEPVCHIGISPGALYLNGTGEDSFVEEAYVSEFGLIAVKRSLKQINKVLPALTFYWLPLADPTCGQNADFAFKQLQTDYGLSENDIRELAIACNIQNPSSNKPCDLTHVPASSKGRILKKIKKRLSENEQELTPTELENYLSDIMKIWVTSYVHKDQDDRFLNLPFDKFSDSFFFGFTFGYTQDSQGKLNQGGAMAYGFATGFTAGESYTFSIFLGKYIDPGVKTLAKPFQIGWPFPGAVQPDLTNNAVQNIAEAKLTNDLIAVPLVSVTAVYDSWGFAFTYLF